MISLTPVNGYNNEHIVLLWNLLLERPQEANISHQHMPTWQQHYSFVTSNPYRAWYIIQGDQGPVGACYITMRNEIGIAILKAHQRKAYARRALQQLLTTHEPVPASPSQNHAKFIANIAPGNQASISLFTGLGAVHIQNTYQL